jgi:hypothetical protein
MCSPLGVRTSFAWRLPFERPLAAEREPEVDDGMRISYANRRTSRPIPAFAAPSIAQQGRTGPYGPAFPANDMIKYTIGRVGYLADVLVDEDRRVGHNRWAISESGRAMMSPRRRSP